MKLIKGRAFGELDSSGPRNLIVVEENHRPLRHRYHRRPTPLDYDIWLWYAKMHPDDFIVLMSD